LIVVQGPDHPALLQHSLIASACTWIAGEPPAVRFACRAKIRYRQREQECEVEVLADGACNVCFTVPQRAVTPGQYVVFYLEDVCLGGAVIEHSPAQ
jgi:tRNA-specific 2-thiouridylase